MLLLSVFHVASSYIEAQLKKLFYYLFWKTFCLLKHLKMWSRIYIVGLMKKRLY